MNVFRFRPFPVIPNIHSNCVNLNGTLRILWHLESVEFHYHFVILYFPYMVMVDNIIIRDSDVMPVSYKAREVSIGCGVFG